jgi:hypothetical protein
MARRKRKHAKRYRYGRKSYTARQLRCRFGKRRAKSIIHGKRRRKGRRRKK